MVPRLDQWCARERDSHKNELGDQAQNTRFFVDQNLKTRVKISLLGPQIVMRKPSGSRNPTRTDPAHALYGSSTADSDTTTREPGRVSLIGRPEGVVRPKSRGPSLQPGPSSAGGAGAASTTYL